MRVYQFRHVGLLQSTANAIQFASNCQFVEVVCYTESMKRLTLLPIALLLVAGCQLSLGNKANTNTNAVADGTMWLNYYPTQCNVTPWGDTLKEKTIIEYYEALGVNVISVEVTPEPTDYITCTACGCGTGETISIQTDATGRGILLEHGFTDEELDEADYADDLPLNSSENVNVDAAGNLNTNVNANASTDDTNSEISESELVDPNTGIELNTEAALSEADADLQARAEQLQIELDTYYSAHGSYPDDVAALNTSVNLDGLTYTPIGVTPADYYDLSIDYSTGREVVNP